jgi:hypothetical protein
MLSASTAQPSRTAEAVAAVHALTDHYVAQNPQARPVPKMTWQEMQRLVAKGLVKLPEEVTRLAKFRRKQLPLVETKQPQTWDTAKLHEEVTTEFRAREKGDNP